MRPLITLLFCLLTSLVWADEPDPPLPALYAVTSVADDDVLNIRAQPDGQADVIGSFDHDAAGIEIIALSREGAWAQVNVVERRGWVAMRFLRSEAIVRDGLGLPEGLQCFGTEPFWDLTFADTGQILLRTPEAETRHDVLSAAPGADFVDLTQGGFRFNWQDGSAEVTAHILPGRCFDGMSDRGHGLHYIDDQGPRIGCCSLN